MTNFSFRDLAYDFTGNYKNVWSDAGSHADQDATVWQPQVGPGQEGFFPVGDLMMSSVIGNGDPNKSHVSILLKDIGEDQTALRPPTGFQWVWANIYQMIAPPGYVALGGIASTVRPNPATTPYRCVRQDLLVQGMVGGQIYNCSGSKGSEWDGQFSSWTISPQVPAPGMVYLSPNTFIPVPYYNQPGTSISFSCLQFLLEDSQNPENFPSPTLSKGEIPPPIMNAGGRTAKVPWFAVKDPGFTDYDRMTKSPYYELVRTDTYNLLLSYNNKTSVEQTINQTVTTGVSQESTESFAHSVGVEIGTEWKVSSAFKISAKLSYGFTHTDSHSTGMMQENSITVSLIAPIGVYAAVYGFSSNYQLMREDGYLVSTNSVIFNDFKNTCSVQYPPLSAGASKALVTAG